MESHPVVSREDWLTALGAMAGAADTMAAITEGAGALIAAVRVLVRDAIATVVSRLIGYALEETASLGLATPVLVALEGGGRCRPSTIACMMI